jgi:nucleoid-associated protein YgaU
MKILTNTRAVASGLAVAALAAAGIGLGAAPANAASTSTWDKLANCESSGNWHINTGNGYYGGLQFSLSTWHGYGGSGNPANASKATQIRIAEKVLAGQGWGAWPSCSARLNLSGSSSATGAAHSVKVKSKAHHTTHHKAKHKAHVKLSGKTYTVKSGDTMAKIAKKQHVKGGWHRLADANPAIGNPNMIFVGQHLHLPA